MAAPRRIRGEVPGPEHVLAGTVIAARLRPRDVPCAKLTRTGPGERLAHACPARLLAHSRDRVARSRAATSVCLLPAIKPGQTLSHMVTIRSALARCASRRTPIPCASLRLALGCAWSTDWSTDLPVRRPAACITSAEPGRLAARAVLPAGMRASHCPDGRPEVDYWMGMELELTGRPPAS